MVRRSGCPRCPESRATFKVANGIRHARRVDQVKVRYTFRGLPGQRPYLRTSAQVANK